MVSIIAPTYLPIVRNALRPSEAGGFMWIFCHDFIDLLIMTSTEFKVAGIQMYSQSNQKSR